jgi:hypothetical protein
VTVELSQVSIHPSQLFTVGAAAAFISSCKECPARAKQAHSLLVGAGQVQVPRTREVLSGDAQVLSQGYNRTGAGRDGSRLNTKTQIIKMGQQLMFFVLLGAGRSDGASGSSSRKQQLQYYTDDSPGLKISPVGGPTERSSCRMH